MPILAAPASLKGVLSAQEASAALAEGFRAIGIPADELPIADGGEGTADVLAAALGGEWSEAEVSDPLGRPVRARWLMLHDETAVIESAEAIGLWRLAPDELDPLRATSRGLGELIQEAARHDPRALLVCLGGSATVDGGEGVREVLTSLPSRTTVLHDVRTTLRDAPRVYGPQKGATPEVIRELEQRLAAIAEVRPYADVPGAGAAGGLGAALAALGAELVLGATAVLARIGFEGRARTAALVVTGEGTVDSTTREGKAPGEAARVCRELGVPCAVFGGRVTDPVPGIRTLRLSGRPERARGDLLALGGQLGRELVAGGS